ncbi:hypothetical protein EVAR_7858_1 [Eumeta japonica]|uniref:MADF domain-containing protein n=1 Tax=Eumeta variegata TaxID=151549 RepID=A0A4C1TV15_EUMVA|nr:hypothetical protein EVAR_7858_1 [Eumeta japonica]
MKSGREGFPIRSLSLLKFDVATISNLYCQQLMRLKRKLEKEWPESINSKDVVFHRDNVRPHTSLIIQQILREGTAPPIDGREAGAGRPLRRRASIILFLLNYAHCSGRGTRSRGAGAAPAAGGAAPRQSPAGAAPAPSDRRRCMSTFCGHVMRDDPEFNIKFIELVEKNPSLYDNTRPDHGNRNKQNKIWADIGKKLNENAYNCKERWKNIRGRYVKQLNKFTPSGPAKKPYYLAEYLQFLDAFVKSRIPTGNLQSTSHPEKEGQTIKQELTDGECSTLSESSEYSNTVSEVNAEATNIVATQSRTYTTRKRRKRKATVEDLNGATVQYPEGKKKCQQSFQSTTDPDMAFLQSVLPDMKNMNEMQKRNFKVAVLNIAGQILNQPVTLPPTGITIERADDVAPVLPYRLLLLADCSAGRWLSFARRQLPLSSISIVHAAACALDSSGHRRAGASRLRLAFAAPVPRLQWALPPKNAAFVMRF